MTCTLRRAGFGQQQLVGDGQMFAAVRHGTQDDP
jgi:hypothetical protein